MIFHDRLPLIDTWFFAGILVQIVLVGAVHYRISGSWASVFFNSGRTTTLRPRQSFDPVSVFCLLLNVGVSLTFFLTNFLTGVFYVKSAFIVASALAAIFFLVWHFDYVVLWFFAQSNPLKLMHDGNILLCFLGLLLLGFNFIQLFTGPISWLMYGVLTLLLLMFFLRIWVLVFVPRSMGFTWYYFILYLCTVYVIPSVLLSKYYESQWLELLTP
ncbi:MAG: DUF4271 domain-containing protein [Bacteroidota bacterium]